MMRICASHEEFHDFFGGLFDQLDALCAELVRRQKAWQSQRRRAERELQQRGEQLQKQLHRVEKELAKVKQQRMVLETELETVRNRAAEMAETLARQRRQSAHEREQWTGELKQVRRLLETLVGQQVQHESAPESDETHLQPQEATGPSPQSASAPAADSDPVLDSVMAQFKMLQKGLGRQKEGSG